MSYLLLDLKRHRQVKAHRVTPLKAEKRLAARRKWKAQIESGGSDLKAVYWNDENTFRLGALKEGNRNLVVYAKNALQKSDIPYNLTLRGGGERRWGVSAIV